MDYKETGVGRWFRKASKYPYAGMSEAESQGGIMSLPQITPHILAPPGYMDLKKKQNSMYMGQESEKKMFLCVAQAVEVARRKKSCLAYLFNM